MDKDVRIKLVTFLFECTGHAYAISQPQNKNKQAALVTAETDGRNGPLRYNFMSYVISARPRVNRQPHS